MAAAMNGMALHGGVIPYSGTFLVFSDYCAPGDPARRADGRARHPCDDARLDRPRRRRPDASAGRASRRRCARSRTCWCSARATRSRRSSAGSSRLQAKDRPSVLALTRQNLPQLRNRLDERQRLRRRRLRDRRAGRRGRRVDLRHRLGSLDRGRGRASCSPAAASPRASSRCRASNCCSQQPEACAAPSSARRASRSRSKPACGRAGTPSSARTALFVGMTTFGASAPYKELYKHFGITAEAVAEAA